MLAAERRQLILEEITRTGHLVTSDLATRLGVSEVTIRSDLDALEKRGRVTRTHGGAVMQDAAAMVVGFDARMSVRKQEKRRIALAARQFVTSGQTVIFDAATTTMHLAQVMPEVSGLIVYTPGITIAQQLLGLDGVEAHVLGGRLDRRWLETIGTPREQGIDDLIVHTLFLGANGIDADLDIVDQSSSLAIGKRQYAQRARSIVLLADSSKWNATGASKVLSLDRVDVVVTDDGLELGTRERIEALGVRLVIA